MNFIFRSLVLCSFTLTQAQEISELWGKQGEKWSPGSRLPDISYAGYHAGEKPLPDVPVIANVQDFGAKGNGQDDDTAAILRAVEATEEGAIYFPPGRYVVSDIIWIRKPNIVLRGAGPDQTVLFFPRTLEDVRSRMTKNSSGKATSSYSWSGGFLWAEGKIERERLAHITEGAKRGETTVEISAPSQPFTPGQWISIVQNDTPDHSLLTHLYAGNPGDISRIKKPYTYTLTNRVVSYEEGVLTLERPLRSDIRLEWTPTIRTYEPSVTEVGIEHLAMEFPVKPYPGHNFTEKGMNGIAFSQVAHSWVRNVTIRNSDSGIFITGDFCTLTGIVLDSERPDPKGSTGHHGISLGRDSVLEQFHINTRFVHDITLSRLANGNVIKNGRAEDLSLDHHKRGPHANLFCNLDAGKGSRLWKSGGGRNLGKNAGAWNTYWAIRSRQPVPLPRKFFAPDVINLVGLNLKQPTAKDPGGRWVEAMSPDSLQPQDLHAAQVTRRLAQSQKEPDGQP